MRSHGIFESGFRIELQYSNVILTLNAHVTEFVLKNDIRARFVCSIVSNDRTLVNSSNFIQHYCIRNMSIFNVCRVECSIKVHIVKLSKPRCTFK